MYLLESYTKTNIFELLSISCRRSLLTANNFFAVLAKYLARKIGGCENTVIEVRDEEPGSTFS